MLKLHDLTSHFVSRIIESAEKSCHGICGGGHDYGGKLAAVEMIRILEGIDTDDDTFPEYEIKLIWEAAGCEK